MTKKKLSVLALNCTLKTSRGKQPASSTERLLTECLEAFETEGVSGEMIRVADLSILPGVSSDEGEGDQWPALRAKIVACDILLLGTPIWVGQPSSIAKRVMERMDAFYGEKDRQGHMPSHGKVAALAVVGNEDGAHHVAACVFQALNDLGFTLAASGMTYWVGEAMGSSEYRDKRKTPDAVDSATKTMAKVVTHLARLLSSNPYPTLPISAE